MNRVVILGIAVFLAIVGMALLGGENKVYAGHGCKGCTGKCGGGDKAVKACCGPPKCAGCRGTKVRRVRRCHGCRGRRVRRCKGGGGKVAYAAPLEYPVAVRR